jgi:hypothetical protein
MAQYSKGLAGIFDTEKEILLAARKMREMGFDQFEALTPYPVHGMEEACGIKRSWIPYVAFIAGLVGLTSGTLLTWWTSAVNWPINVGGKPFFSLPAFIPVMFELTILFSALSSVGALFFVCGLPKVRPPIIHPDLSSHKFAIFIPESQKGFDQTKVTEVFHHLGASEVKVAEF